MLSKLLLLFPDNLGQNKIKDGTGFTNLNLGFCPNLKHFIVNFEENIVKYAEPEAYWSCIAHLSADDMLIGGLWHVKFTILMLAVGYI